MNAFKLIKRYSISLIITNIIYTYGTDKFKTFDDLPSPWVWGETVSIIDRSSICVCMH